MCKKEQQQRDIAQDFMMLVLVVLQLMEKPMIQMLKKKFMKKLV